MHPFTEQRSRWFPNDNYFFYFGISTLSKVQSLTPDLPSYPAPALNKIMLLSVPSHFPLPYFLTRSRGGCREALECPHVFIIAHLLPDHCTVLYVCAVDQTIKTFPNTLPLTVCEGLSALIPAARPPWLVDKRRTYIFSHATAMDKNVECVFVNVMSMWTSVCMMHRLKTW